MEKIKLKVGVEMQLILNRGNKDAAFSILESTIAVFITSLLLLAVLGLIITFQKRSNSIHEYLNSYIEAQNMETYGHTK